MSPPRRRLSVQAMKPSTLEGAERTGMADSGGQVEPTEQIELLMRDLRSSPDGLSTAEVQRRPIQYGPNEMTRRGGLKWPRELARQLTHPLALLPVARCRTVLCCRQSDGCDRGAVGDRAQCPVRVRDAGTETLPSLALSRDPVARM
jgi:hypothetical protein